MSVYDRKAFGERVSYAKLCFLRGSSHTRHFDTCFEMADGDAVVTSLVRKAREDNQLWRAIARDWGGTFPQNWIDTEAKYADVPTNKLGKLAAELREKWDASLGGRA